MACPTCDHTMQSLGYADGGTIWHCPRCGTVKHHDQFADAPPKVYVPKLVERCRECEEHLPRVTRDGGQFHIAFRPWFTLGIAEAINPPGQRGDE